MLVLILGIKIFLFLISCLKAELAIHLVFLTVIRVKLIVTDH